MKIVLDKAKYKELKKAGLIKYGTKLGKSPHARYLWVQCPICGKERWAFVGSDKSYSEICKSCSNYTSPNRYEEYKCKQCRKVYKGYKNRSSGFCSTKCKTAYMKSHDAIKWKAYSIGANLLLGKGKLDAIGELLRESLGKLCRYCGTKLTLKNISLDHKIPVGKSDYRRNKTQYKEERTQMDALDNLQLICRKCNSLKGNFTDYEFESLLNFLNLNKQLEEKLLKRLSGAHIWRWRK